MTANEYNHRIVNKLSWWTKMEMSDFEIEEYRKLDRTGRVRYRQRKAKKHEDRSLIALVGSIALIPALIFNMKIFYLSVLLVLWPIIPVLSPRTDYRTLIEARKTSHNLKSEYCFTHGAEKLYNSSEQEFQCVYCQ